MVLMKLFAGQYQDADTENEHADVGVGKGRGMTWEIRIDEHTLLCVK